MNIEVEIGTDEQKELIKEEINYVLSDFKNEDFEIVVPIDFDKHIQKRLNDDRFISSRSSLNQFVMGKQIGENHIAINPILYTENINGQIRANYYLHEYNHFANKRRFVIKTKNSRDKKLISFLISPFDEYSSNRFAFERTKKLYDLNKSYEEFFKTNSIGHSENFSNSEIYSNKFDDLIYEYQIRNISIMEFVGKIEPLIERYSIELISYFSIIDSFEIDPINVNITDLSLIELFRESYKSGNYSFENKIPFIEKYLRTFGISIENHENGLYYNVFEREQ